MIVGMTGTRQGMTRLQKMKAIEYLRLWRPDICIHGCCHGADQDFHQLCAILPLVPKMEGYPASPSQVMWARKRRFHLLHVQYDFMGRNEVMAERADKFLAFPKETEEVIRSGTWATVRRRRKAGKLLVIVYPDGTASIEK